MFKIQLRLQFPNSRQSSDEILVSNDGVSVYTKENKTKMKKTTTNLNKEFEKIAKYLFTTCISVQETFAQTVIANFNSGFAGLTFKQDVGQNWESQKKSRTEEGKKQVALVFSLAGVF